MSPALTPQPAARLTLLGTVHRDPLGEERLTQLLAELQPEVVTLEMSPAALDYRRRQGRLLLQRLGFILERLAKERATTPQQLAALPAISDIRALLELPFEYRAVQAYITSSGRSCALLDSSEISLKKLHRVETDLMTYQNLKVLIGLPADDAGDQRENYATARALLCDTPLAATRQAFLARCRGPEGIGPRDRHMAEQLRPQLRPGRHVLHVGGWVHLVDDPQGATLYNLLADCRPTRRLLTGEILSP